MRYPGDSYTHESLRSTGGPDPFKRDGWFYWIHTLIEWFLPYLPSWAFREGMAHSPVWLYKGGTHALSQAYFKSCSFLHTVLIVLITLEENKRSSRGRTSLRTGDQKDTRIADWGVCTCRFLRNVDHCRFRLTSFRWAWATKKWLNYVLITNLLQLSRGEGSIFINAFSKCQGQD